MKNLGPRQINGLNKLGDCMISGGSGLPGFSASGCVRHADRILDYMPEQDKKDLGMLLGIFSLLPRFGVAIVIRLLEMGAVFPGPVGAVIRFVRIGVRGLVMSLYFGDPGVLAAIGYEVKVYTGDMRS